MVERYSPANGSEGEWFHERFCYQCKHHSWPVGTGCEIQLRALVYRRNAPQYPDEWTFDAEGQPTCTAFEEVP